MPSITSFEAIPCTLTRQYWAQASRKTSLFLDGRPQVSADGEFTSKIISSVVSTPSQSVAPTSCMDESERRKDREVVILVRG